MKIGLTNVFWFDQCVVEFDQPDKNNNEVDMQRILLLTAASSLVLAGCMGSSSDTRDSEASYRELPDWSSGGVSVTQVDGQSDDLLTGGSLDSDSGAVVPVAVTSSSERADIRRYQLGNSYKSMMDGVTPGGWGHFWGPEVTDRITSHNVDAFTGQVSGTEYMTLADSGNGQTNVKLVVQIPSTFDTGAPCIIAGPSSGSRGVYGAAGTAGDAALKRGCAVAYTDKGTGDGVHLIGSDEVLNLDGQIVSAEQAGTDSAFTADYAQGFRETTDPRTATTKHAHSQQNPGKDWGLNTLQSIEFAFYALNQAYPDQGLNPDNTTVIAASWSNGGRSVLMAAEQDTQGLIDGVVSVEPSTAMAESDFTIRQGDRSWEAESVGWSLYDFHAFGAIYQTCANNLEANSDADLTNAAKSEARCTRLKALGLLTSSSDDLQVLAQEAQDRMNTTAGFLPEQNLAIPAFSSMFSEITATYGNSYGRYRISDELCGISFASWNGGTKQFEVLSDEDKAQRFIGQNMIAGGSRWIQPVNTYAADPYSATAFNSTDDMNLDGDLCFFAMSQYGHAELTALGLLDTYKRNGDFERVQAGITEAKMSGNVQDKPVIILHGRSDQVIAPNHGGRAYYGRNRQISDQDNVVYWEIENGHHLEMFGYLLAPNLGFYADPSNMKHRYAYIHPYFDTALNQMFAHLKEDAPLYPSQVIRTTSMMESGRETITEEMFGAVQAEPDASDRIQWTENTLVIPD